MQDNSNYGVAVLELSRAHPDRTAFRGAEVSVTLAQVASLMTRFAVNLKVRGVDASSSVVILDPENHPRGLTLALACGLLGARWVAYGKNMPFAALGTTHFMSIGSPPPEVSHPRTHVVDDSWSSYPASWDTSRPESFKGFSSSDDIALFVGTSGTTGSTKYVARSGRYLWDKIQSRSTAEYKLIHSRFPFTSAQGFRLALGGLLQGSTLAIANDVAQLAKIGTEAVYASPNQVDGLCKDVQPLAHRISHLRVGGSMISKQALARWFGYFERIEVSYGSRDGGGGGFALLSEPTDEITYAPYPGVEFEVVDVEQKPVRVGVVGEVRLKTPVTAHEYVGAPEATAEVFRDGWFYPGDLGSLSADGRLSIVGRTKDQFNIGGVKFNASAIDEAIAAVVGVEHAASFTRQNAAGSAELAVLVVPAAGADFATTAAAIRMQCMGLGKTMVPRSIYFATVMPANASGKVPRGDLPLFSAALPAY